VLVAGPYDARRPGSGRLLASGNQTLHVAPHAAERYGEWLAESGPALQVVVDDGDIQLVGLPRPGDLARFRAGLVSRGVSLEEVSWRS
jgi:anaerobic ribonucleoside-triphosphate reductase activating protein